MKSLGIDFGTKKIGLATSDDRGVLAFPHSVIKNDGKTIKEILDIIEKEKITEVVVGKSLNFAQEENAVMKEILIFKESLEKAFKGPIFFQNETLSSKQATNTQAKDENTDSRAAAIILQSFIDSRPRK